MFNNNYKIFKMLNKIKKILIIRSLTLNQGNMIYRKFIKIMAIRLFFHL